MLISIEHDKLMNCCSFNKLLSTAFLNTDNFPEICLFLKSLWDHQTNCLTLNFFSLYGKRNRCRFKLWSSNKPRGGALVWMTWLPTCLFFFSKRTYYSGKLYPRKLVSLKHEMVLKHFRWAFFNVTGINFRSVSISGYAKKEKRCFIYSQALLKLKLNNCNCECCCCS